VGDGKTKNGRNNTMRKLRPELFVSLAAAILMLTQATLSAGTITDTVLGVTYTATSTFAPLIDNTFDVFLTVNPTAFSAGSGFLTAISMQFKTGPDIPSSVFLLTAPGGVGAWSSVDVGGLNKQGCDGSNPTSGFVCFQYTNTSTTNTPVPGSPYNFEFAVKMPGSDALTAASGVKAAYNEAVNNSGTNLGVTALGITITPSAIPEPTTLGLMGAGLLGIGAIRWGSRRRPS
jgi:hypothetical protein